MKTLVTGGTGFTGSHLVRRLLEEGHEVVVLDNQPGLFAEELQSLGAEVVIGSITDQELLDRLTEGCDYVQHLAAAFRKINVPKKVYWDVNVEGTRKVLESAKKHGVKRVVYCSTQGVHGHVEHPPGDEDSPIEPEDYYQYTKWEGERVCHEYMAEGMEISIVRPTAIYGPGDPGRFLLLFKMSKDGRFLMFGDGKTTYHPVYIDNLVDLFILAAEHPAAVGRTYLGADAHYYTLNDLVKAVGRAMGIDVKIWHLPFRPLWLAAVVVEAVCWPLRISPPLFRRRVDWFRQVRAFKIDRAREELGYEAKVGIDEGLSETYKWYIEEGYL
ncbi:MAG: NAD(P)-dependent oxidoreductase [Gemmatimonadetes bacterium]|nr:NAD(P)-dependent oxidoreductase [Gemmatimonadota bacterium]